MHLKNTFFIKSSFFCWSEGSPEGPLEFPDVRIFREPSGDVPGMSQAGWVSSRLTSRYARKTQTDQSIPQPFLICLQKNDPQIFKRGSNKSPFLQWVCMSLVQVASNVFYSMEQLEDISFHNKLSLLWDCFNLHLVTFFEVTVLKDARILCVISTIAIRC